MNMDKLYCIGYIDDELIEKADKYIKAYYVDGKAPLQLLFHLRTKIP